MKRGETFWKDVRIYRVIAWDTYVEEEREATISGDNSNVPDTGTQPLIRDRQLPIRLGYI